MVVRKDHTMEFPAIRDTKPSRWQRLIRFIKLFKHDPNRY